MNMNIFETLRQRSEQKRTEELEYLSKQFAYSKDNVIYVAGVPIYAIADEESGEWVKTPSQATAYIAMLRKCFIEHDGGEQLRRL